jgi:ABC-type enterochelin transport system ATPase subunit
MTIDIPVEVYDTDYVLFDEQTQRPLGNLDIIYSYESVIELVNDGFALGENEVFVKMIDLPKELLQEYATQIIKNK